MDYKNLDNETLTFLLQVARLLIKEIPTIGMRRELGKVATEARRRGK